MTHFNQFFIDLWWLWHSSEKKTHRKRVVDVPQSVGETRVPFLHNMIDWIRWFARYNSFFFFPVPLFTRFFQAASENLNKIFQISRNFNWKNNLYFLLSKFLNNRLVCQKLDIFHVKPCFLLGASLVHFLFVSRLVWINAFQNAKPPLKKFHFKIKTSIIGNHINLPKIFQRKLKLSKCRISWNVIRCSASFMLKSNQTIIEENITK